MNSDSQIQSIKSHIENLKMQIDNIETQNNSMMMGNSRIGEQLINLSIQMLNTGIQTFILGKDNFEMIDITKFHNQIKKIKEQIKSIESETEPMNPMMGNPMGMGMADSQDGMQQQMMQQQMMQQQMMQQQMMQQQMMQQQMMQQQQAAEMQRQMQEILNGNNTYNDYLKFVFKHVNGTRNEIKIRKGKKVKDLLEKYINAAFISDGKSLTFLYNAAKIDKNDQRRVEEVFKNSDIFTITIIG